MAAKTGRKRHEILGVLMLMLAALVVTCLLTYNPGDSSFNSRFYRSEAQNWAGRIGAHASDLLLQVFGLAAFLIALPLIVVGWKLAFGIEIRSPAMRAAGVLLLLCTASAGLQIFLPDFIRLSYEPGGTVGALLSAALLPYLNQAGTGILLGGILVIALLASTTLSIGGIRERLATEGTPSVPGWRERFRAWREQRKKTRRTVNIRTKAPAAPEVAPRPSPVRPALATPPPETSPPTVKPPEPEPPPPEPKPRGRKYVPPPIELLTQASGSRAVDEVELMERARQLSEKCAEFDVHGSITQIHPGPVVTTFEFKPDAGVKYSRITGLVDDLCLGVKAESIRIDRIPGKATVGMEIPNTDRETIMLREIIESEPFRKSQSRLTLAIGKLINGSVYLTELARMPHLLIAGATGSGKSVGLNCMITSILYKAAPEEVRFIFIDPKRLELGIYADIPHLLTPIVTDPKEAANALRWATSEMEARYRKLALRGVRNIDQYNNLLRSTARQLSLLEKEDPGGELEKPLPYLVLVIDELADLMMVSSREVEEAISRLAAMARAVGIHLILATQRPSVDVITGVIKANFPCRIAYKVASKVDSRTILDSNGAEQLLGNGDMLFIPPGSSRMIRIHGAYVSEREAQDIVKHLRQQGRPRYDDSVLSYGQEDLDEAGNPIAGPASDPLYHDAVRIVVSEGRASTSLLQRRLSIGYGRAAKLIDMMFQNGLVGPAEGSKPREVLAGLEFLDRLES